MNRENVIKLMLKIDPEMVIMVEEHEEGMEGFTGEDPKLLFFWPFENYVKFAALVAAAEREKVLLMVDEMRGSEQGRNAMFSEGYDYAMHQVETFVKE